MGTTRRPSLSLMALAIAAAVALLVPQPASAAAGFGSNLETDAGLRTARFTTPHGDVLVYAPASLAAGDAYSLGIRLQARGARPGVRLGNLQALGSLLVGFGDDLAAADGGVLQGRVPDTSSAALAVTLRGVDGQILASLDLPLLRGEQPITTDMQAPAVGHAGQGLVVQGAFDGDLSTSEISLGGRAIAAVAESPRDVAVLLPDDQLGPATLRVVENGLATDLPFRSIAIRVEAPTGILAEGERGEVQVTVAGLQGLDESLPVLTINRTPEVVELIGGSKGLLRHQVAPQQVAADGTHRFSIEVSGRQPGQFELAVSAVIAVTTRQHTPNVTFPPEHYVNVTYPSHEPNISWPPGHAINVSFPDHTTDVTWPPAHVINLSWPVHVVNLTVWQDPPPPPPPKEEEPKTTGTLDTTGR